MHMAKEASCLSVWCGSWNAHTAGRKVTASQLSAWIDVGVHDIYAISVQEAERSIAASVLNWSKPKWEAALRAAFMIHGRDGDEYCLLSTQDVGATQIALVARRRLLPQIRLVRQAFVTAGYVCGLLPNKGGAAIACNIGATSMLFVGAHLAPHAKAMRYRDHQFRSIDRALHSKLVSGVGGCCGCDWSSSRDSGATASSAFDRVFWMGDLNYRVQIEMEEAARLTEPTAGDVARSGLGSREAYDRAAVAQMLAADQQGLAHSAPTSAGFLEAPIAFWPTYKFDRKSGYTRYKLKHRKCAWLNPPCPPTEPAVFFALSQRQATPPTPPTHARARAPLPSARARVAAISTRCFHLRCDVSSLLLTRASLAAPRQSPQVDASPSLLDRPRPLPLPRRPRRRQRPRRTDHRALVWRVH